MDGANANVFFSTSAASQSGKIGGTSINDEVADRFLLRFKLNVGAFISIRPFDGPIGSGKVANGNVLDDFLSYLGARTKKRKL